MSDVYVPVRFLSATAKAPEYAHSDDAGADLFADEHVVIPKGERRAVSTGISIAVPEGYVALVHPRSGLAKRHGVTVTNAPGTIDAGYRGEILVLLSNFGNDHIAFMPGDKIAQLVIQKVEHATFHNVEELTSSVRGANGFGSTG